MPKSFLRHSFEHIFVLVILLLAIFLLNFFKGFYLRLAVIAILSIFYVAVGIIHHYEEKNLKLSQILEYSAIGALMFVVLFSLYH